MIGYEYGNTRLRAMRSRLIEPDRFPELIATGSLDRLLGALHDTPYASDVAAAVARFRGPRRLAEATRANLARTLRAMRSYYRDAAGGRVELLVRRWDLHNLQCIFRGRARLASTDEIVALLVPAGVLGDAELGALAAAPGVRAVIDLMVTWGMPTPRAARRLLAAWPRFEHSGEIGTLEQALASTWAESLEEALPAAEPATPADLILRSEIDRVNLLTALRLRAARLAGEPLEGGIEERLLPSGRTPARVLRAAGQADQREDVAAALQASPAPSGWAEAVAAWVGHGDLVRLTDDLETATTVTAIRLFTQGDPLSEAIPIAYTFAKENEIRNLRRIGYGITHGLSASEIGERLVVAA